jgi:hypothetical protein
MGGQSARAVQPGLRAQQRSGSNTESHLLGEELLVLGLDPRRRGAEGSVPLPAHPEADWDITDDAKRGPAAIGISLILQVLLLGEASPWSAPDALCPASKAIRARRPAPDLPGRLRAGGRTRVDVGSAPSLRRLACRVCSPGPPGRGGHGLGEGGPTAVAGGAVCERSSASGPVRRILSARYAAAGGDRPQASCPGGILQQQSRTVRASPGPAVEQSSIGPGGGGRGVAEVGLTLRPPGARCATARFLADPWTLRQRRR